MTDELKVRLENIFEESKKGFEDNKKNLDTIRQRIHSLNESVQSLTLPVMLNEKNSEQLNKSLDVIIRELEKLNSSFQLITPKNILKGFFSEWSVILTIICIASTFGLDILSIIPELKKFL